MAVLQFRPYKVRRAVVSEFLTGTSTFNKQFADQDLAASGLNLDDLFGYAVDNLPLPQGAAAGYLIPYFDLNGDVIRDADNNAAMYRVKLKLPAFSKAQRYTQPSGEELANIGLPAFLPYLYPCPQLAGDTIYVCEGEKKTVSFIKNLQLPAFGIGGCTMWRNPNGTGGPHPWILDYLGMRTIKNVIIIPDGDVFRYDICAAYGTFAHALSQCGFNVSLLNPPGKIDDLIVEWGNGARVRLESLPSLLPNELVQTAASLATTYDLAFKRTRDDKVVVHQHTSNIMRLMRNHPAFPIVWLNRDTNKVMVGQQEAVPDKTDMDITNHMQHNFQLEKINHTTIRQCMRALSRENERSPMLEHIQAVGWDGVPRLDTWMIDTWGLEDNAFVREVSAKWLIAACARMAAPGSKVDWMLIVVGPQSVGKTSMPSIIFKGNNTILYGEHDNKDLHMLLHSSLCIGFDELDTFTRKDTSLLKAMVTTTEDMLRPPYGATIETFKRRFTLYGCGNRTEFLQNDPSGQRRYAILEVSRLLDFKKLEGMVDQLWAEAWQRYCSDSVKWWEVAGATENARRFEIANILEERIVRWIDNELTSKVSARVVNGQFMFSMTELMEGLNEKVTNGSSLLRDASAILRSLGYENKVKFVNGKTKKVFIATRD